MLRHLYCLLFFFFLYFRIHTAAELTPHHSSPFEQEFKSFLTKYCSCFHQLYLQVVKYVLFVSARSD